MSRRRTSAKDIAKAQARVRGAGYARRKAAAEREEAQRALARPQPRIAWRPVTDFERAYQAFLRECLEWGNPYPQPTPPALFVVVARA